MTRFGCLLIGATVLVPDLAGAQEECFTGFYEGTLSLFREGREDPIDEDPTSFVNFLYRIDPNFPDSNVARLSFSFFGPQTIIFEGSPGGFSGSNLELENLQGTASPGFLQFTAMVTGTNRRIEYIGSCQELCGSNTIQCGGTGEIEGEGEPEPETFIRWNAMEGAFGLAANWDPEQVPTANEVAVYDTPGSTATVMIDSAESRRAEIRRGSVNFVGGTYTLVHDSLTNRSLEVGGSDSANLDALTLTEHSLTTVHSAVGREGNLAGIVEVGPNSIWENMGRLSVGFGAEGMVVVEVGGTLTSGETRIGDIQGGPTSNLLVGDSLNEGGEGTAFVATGNLAVGLDGSGDLAIFDSGRVVTDEQVTIGGEQGSSGFIRILGSNGTSQFMPGGNVDVGVSGEGVLSVDGGNDVSVPGNLRVGIEGTGRGTVEIDVGSSITVTGDLEVGTAGDGVVEVSGQLISGDGFVGTGVGGMGDVELTGSNTVWNAGAVLLGRVLRNELGNPVRTDGRGRIILGGSTVFANVIDIEFASEIVGSGALIAGEVSGDGTVDPGIQGAEKFDEGAVEKQFISGRVLEIEGALNLDGGVIDATVNAASEFDQLHVTGNATLTDTTIVVRFADGFSPEEGGEMPIILVDGTLTTQNLTAEVEGLSPDFALVLTNINGMLMVTTTAIPQTQEGEGEGDGTGGGCAARYDGPGSSWTLLGDWILILCLVGWLSATRRSARSR